MDHRIPSRHVTDSMPMKDISREANLIACSWAVEPQYPCHARPAAGRLSIDDRLHSLEATTSGMRI
jgi:hypothetical protein